MKREELLQRIWIDPQRCFGKHCIRGHRIWVSLILDLLATGTPAAENLEDYPGLTTADIHACIAYGAEMSRERYSASRSNRRRETQTRRIPRFRCNFILGPETRTPSCSFAM